MWNRLKWTHSSDSWVCTLVSVQVGVQEWDKSGATALSNSRLAIAVRHVYSRSLTTVNSSHIWELQSRISYLMSIFQHLTGYDLYDLTVSSCIGAGVHLKV